MHTEGKSVRKIYIKKWHMLFEKHAPKMCIVLALILAALVTGCICRRVDMVSRAQLQGHLADEVLRFHVLANSDSEADQTQKLAVRDAVLDYLEAEMPQELDEPDTEMWVRKHIDQIREVGSRAAAGSGEAYPVSAAVTTCWFPDKTYGDLTFPAGNYQALRIEIGAAEGHNWWCVLYPSLCFEDSVNAVVPGEGRQKLKNVLTEEEYSRITASTKFKIRWFFW